MRRNPTKRVERYRVTTGPMWSTKEHGANGAFMIPFDGVTLIVVVSDGSDWRNSGLPGEPWEHVSVSTKARCPTWEEMQAVKEIFWRDDEVVMELHAPKTDHINMHEYCLHLWKPKRTPIPLPPPITVGVCDMVCRFLGRLDDRLGSGKRNRLEENVTDECTGTSRQSPRGKETHERRNRVR